jgi:hypothetical protein
MKNTQKKIYSVYQNNSYEPKKRGISRTSNTKHLQEDIKIVALYLSFHITSCHRILLPCYEDERVNKGKVGRDDFELRAHNLWSALPFFRGSKGLYLYGSLV